VTVSSRSLVALRRSAARVVVAKSIRQPVRYALRLAGVGAIQPFVLPFPAQSHEATFERGLVGVLRAFRRKRFLK
jgi:hypothetical protein